MITQAPLPEWKILFRTLLPRTTDYKYLVSPWCREGDVAGYLSYSSWSLALIAVWRIGNNSPSSVTVWIPDYFCNASLKQLRSTGVKLLFYPVSSEMVPDMANCRAQLDQSPPDIFLLVHYFGKPATNTATVRDICTRYGAWLIEDAAHVLRQVSGIGEYGDFVLYSPHKLLPMPDGAILVVRSKGPSKFGKDIIASFGIPDSWPGQLSILKQKEGLSFKNTWMRITTWLIKRILQKSVFFNPGRSTFIFPESMSLVSYDEKIFAHPVMSIAARRLLAQLIPDLGTFARQRQRNELFLEAIISDYASNDKTISLAERSEHRKWTPYLTSYNVDAIAGDVFDDWQHKGLPVTTWPDLPPEVIADYEHHINAWHLRHSRIYLPVHQSLRVKALKKCFPTNKKIDDQRGIKLEWNNIDREQWNGLMNKAGRSNLLTTWAYGEAKSFQQGWKIQRGVFYKGNEPIAFVQVLQKSFLGLPVVVRINRGPLQLRPLSPDEQKAIWKMLTKLGTIWRCKILTVAPELTLTGSSLLMMSNLSFRQFSGRAWESVWMDLTIDIELLRRNLSTEWRNKLNIAEKVGFTIISGTDDLLFNWMMLRYEELMRAKNFSGPSIGFLRILRKKLNANEQLIIMQALHEEEAVAGICVALHGTAATYLIGWNGIKGRNLKANQYLLWQAIVHLKKLGVHWLDLGGISEALTPGITKFKLGLNGERYENIGEYIKF